MVDKKLVKKHIIDVEDQEQIELNIDPAIVEFIILKARAFDVKVAPVETDPGSDAIDDEDRGVIEDDASDQTETELKDAIEQLSEDAAIELVAMFWVGRGEFGIAEWQEAKTMALERGNTPLASYLMGEPSLGDFLEEGLTALGYTPQEYGPE